MKTNTFMKKMDGIRKAAINTSAAVISAPARIKSIRSQETADKDFGTLRAERGYKGAPDFEDNGMPSEAFKVRSYAKEVKSKLISKKK